MTLRGVIRRAGFDRVSLVAGTLTILVALVLVATGPVYADAVTLGALRAELTDLPPDRTSLIVDSSVASGDLAAVDQVVTARVERAIAPTGGSISRRLVTDAFEIVDRPAGDGLVALALLQSVEGIEVEAALLDGAWPRRGSAASTVEVAIDDRVATSLDVGVGDVIDLTGRRDPDLRAAARVVGRYSVDRPTAPFWAADVLLADGPSESNLFRTHALIAAPADVIALAERPSATWLALPDLGSATLDDIDPLRRRAAALASGLDSDLDTVLGATRSPVEVTTALPDALVRSDRALTVTRSSVFAVTLQLSVLAGYALVLVAGLIADSRTEEFEVLRVRGASPRQLLGRATAEAATLTLPAALVAPQLAVWFATAVGHVGPLARTGLTIEPRPVTSARVAVAVAVLVTVALLAWPTFRRARSAQRATDGVRRRPRSSAQRAGLDIAVAALAALTMWQLSTLGDERAASIRGRFGVDPLLVVAPALGLFAGAFLALRVVPLVARTAEVVASGARSAVPALAGWQVARRPVRYARSALLLIMAVALGVFASTYQSTWERSQVAQATHRAGADVRVEPNRRTNDSIADLHLRSAYEGVPGVETAMPLVRRRGSLPNGDRPAEIVALDARAAGDVVGDPELAVALAVLADGRPDMPTVPVPPHTTALELAIEVREIDAPDEEHPESFDAVVQLVLRDGHGMLHRVPAGTLSSADGRVVLSAQLAVDDPVSVAPAAPLGIASIELRSDLPSHRSRRVGIELVGLDAVSADDDRTPVDAGRWSFASSVVGSLDEPAAIADASADSAAPAAALVTTGRSQFGATAVYAIQPVGDPVPDEVGVLVSRTWFDANERSLGDPVDLDALSRQDGRIVGVVDAFPTIVPADAFVVLVDLPTVAATSYEAGATLLTIDELWLATDRPMLGALQAEPYEAVSVVERDELGADLLADPPAVGTIGSMTIGFLTAAALAVVGFLVAATVSARDRAGEFALLRALGLTSRQLAAWTFLEQAALIVLSIVIGTGVGLGLAAFVLPAVALTSGGGEVYPTVDVVYPWASIVAVQAVVLAGLVATVLGINLALRRLAVARQLRVGAA